MQVKNKIIVITGASNGIGKVLAQHLKAEGAQVFISGHKKEELEKTAAELGVESFLADVREEVQMQSLAKEVIEKFGVIDMWVNNAGVFHSFSSEDKFVDMEKAHNMMNTNFFGTLFGCRTALHSMKSGYIVNILSTAGLDASRAKNAKIYAATKWAVRGYTQAIRAQNDHVKILEVYPGGTQTGLYLDNRPESYDDYMKPEYVVEKIVTNLKEDEPEEELIIRRPKA